jgi:hypothetical protein
MSPRLLICGLLLALTPVLSAQDRVTAIDVSDLAEGQSLVVTKKGGVITVRPLTLLKTGQTPTDPVDPPPGPVLTAFEKEIQAQTKTVLVNEGGSKTTGAALSEVYSRVSAGVSNGSIAPEQSLAAIKAATNLVLAEMPDKASWGGWRTAVSDALSALQQEGSLATKAQYAAAYKQVANGLNAATGYSPIALTKPGKGILDGIDIDKIIKLIELIMTLLKLFGG